MWLRVEHATSFAYDAPIAEAYTELRLRPLGTGGQICSSFRIVTDPPGVPIRGYQDHVGNDVRHLGVLEEHDRIAITAVSEVLTPEAYVDGQSEPSPLERHDYLLPTGYVPLTDPVRALAGDHRVRGGAAARASELMRAVRARLDYVPGATDVHSRADEVLELGRGVCQDFAHVLLAACRCEGSSRAT